MARMMTLLACADVEAAAASVPQCDNTVNKHKHLSLTSQQAANRRTPVTTF